MDIFISALRTSWRVASAGQRVRGVGMALALSAGLVAVGGGLGRGLFPRMETRETTHNHIVYQDRAVAQVVEKPVDRWRTVTHTEYDPACHDNEIKSTTVVQEHEHSDGSVTQVTLESHADQTTDTVRVSTPVKSDRARVAALGGLRAGGGYAFGLEGGYRIVGPLELGGAAILVLPPPLPTGTGPELLLLLEVGWRF